MSEPKKSILYIDANDEITSVISKLQDAPQRIVAIVLPKRAAAFQSSINLKLLKKSADKAKKNAVLITSDNAILPLAAVAGVHVAKTPQSKPYIPQVPSVDAEAETDSIVDASDEAAVDSSKPVGELALAASQSDEDSIDVSDFPPIDLPEDGKANPKKKSKKPRIPNFNKFRLWLILGVVAVILLVLGWYLAAFVLPRATIVLETSTQSSAQTIEFSARTDQDAVDGESFTIPAAELTFEVEDSETVSTTGEENKGDKAEGEVELQNCMAQNGSVTIPSGTEINSGNATFITTEEVELPERRVGGVNRCETPTKDVDVEAKEPGKSYNVDARSYTVTGFDQVRAEGSEMSGGTDDIVKKVDERDVRTARQQIEQGATTSAQPKLEEMHQVDGNLPLPESFVAGDANVSSSPRVGDEADKVTVSSSVTYAMLGLSSEDVRQLIELHMEEEIDTERQAIVNDGLDEATFRIIDTNNEGVTIRLRTIVAIGPDINVDELKELVGGLKRSETESQLLTLEGVRDVQIDYSPFWVFATPGNKDKIEITIEQQRFDEDEDEEAEEEQQEE